MYCLAKIGHVVILLEVPRILLLPLLRKAPEYKQRIVRQIGE